MRAFHISFCLHIYYNKYFDNFQIKRQVTVLPKLTGGHSLRGAAGLSLRPSYGRQPLGTSVKIDGELASRNLVFHHRVSCSLSTTLVFLPTRLSPTN